MCLPLGIKTATRMNTYFSLISFMNIQEFEEVDRKVCVCVGEGGGQASWNDLKMCAMFQNKQTSVKPSS
jgi:hypothetical protein